MAVYESQHVLDSEQLHNHSAKIQVAPGSMVKEGDHRQILSLLLKCVEGSDRTHQLVKSAAQSLGGERGTEIVIMKPTRTLFCANWLAAGNRLNGFGQCAVSGNIDIAADTYLRLAAAARRPNRDNLYSYWKRRRDQSSLW